MEQPSPLKRAETLDAAVKKAIDASKDVRRLLRRTPVRQRLKRELLEAACHQTFQ